ncbi:alpha/beta fold hydrolase [Nitrococcus mobilis]|uniref:Alpha/beta hydrolase n=1 Tax=Nitrococcus mobilis Nb-231 TaxID=314278 RepID=A4BUV1_9GAMM|nr:alpha/beta hydrolase [Nitrococcus mobilis]EAR20465.1 hypothetical protein NB231_06925 [Nitrococcus mobilis Nb-231]
MGLKAEILAFHGWGFDCSAWSAWPLYLASFWQLQAFDRGYYGNSYDPVFSDPNARKIIFTHSYGLHLCPPRQLDFCDLLVIFSGFLHFHPQAPRLQGKSRLILQRMQEQFALEPGAVMRRFMRRCYAPAPYQDHLNREFDRSRLAEDLRLLDHSKMAVTTLERARRVIILHGSEDRIVPSSQGWALFDTLGPQALYHEIEGAGHALPFSHAQQCWAILEPALRNL